MENEWKAIKVSGNTHAELTGLVGHLTAKSCKVKTYEDAIVSLLHNSVIMEPELLEEIEKFIKANKDLGYITKAEFLSAGARGLLHDFYRHEARAKSTSHKSGTPKEASSKDGQNS